MCSYLAVAAKKIKLFVRVVWLPLFVLALSIVLYEFTNPNISRINKLVSEISLALVSAAVFYFFTVTMPNVRKIKIAKKFSIEQYSSIKHQIITDVMQFLKKYPLDNQKIKKYIHDYKKLREYLSFSEEDYYYISNNYTKQFSKEMANNLRQIKEIFAFLATYDFVQGNNILYRRIFYLNSYINHFLYEMELRYSDNNDYDFHKTIGDVIYSFILGFSIIEGYRDFDDFAKLLEDA